MVPVVVASSVLGTDRIRSQVIELLSPLAPRLPAAWRKAADEGLRDPELATLAGKIGQLALDAAIGDDRYDSQSVETTDRFLERFTLRGLAPGDELGPLLASPVDALNWALAEPVEAAS